MNVSLVRKSISVMTLSIMLMGCNQEIPIDDTTLSNSLDTVTIGTTEPISTTTPTNDTTLPSTPTVDSTADTILQTTTLQDDTTTTESSTNTTVTTKTTTVTTEQQFFGYSLSEVESIANTLYTDACTKYRSVLIDGSYGVNFLNSISDQSGRRYYAVDNPYYTSVEDVLNDWHTVFSQDYDYLITSNYIMYEDWLYAYTAIQQTNTNYSSTKLTYYYPTNEYELTFKATSSYSSGDKVFKFSILYDPDTDVWRVSQFTMPY